MPTITITTATHDALKTAAEKREVGIASLAESLLLAGIAKRDRDAGRRQLGAKTKTKTTPVGKELP